MEVLLACDHPQAHHAEAVRVPDNAASGQRPSASVAVNRLSGRDLELPLLGVGHVLPPADLQLRQIPSEEDARRMDRAVHESQRAELDQAAKQVADKVPLQIPVQAPSRQELLKGEIHRL